jgi:lipoprotein NlpI
MPTLPVLQVVAVAIGLVLPVRSLASEPTPRALFDDAVRLFFEAKPVESARVFDQLVRATPAAEPELWQRGLALYYAERFDDGVKQFDLHRTVNPNDVENAAWHFLCVARLEGLQAARAKLLPVGEDSRVPMKEIMDLYAGRCMPADVLAAAEQGAGEARRNQLCYAHLYLGLFFEATADATKAREHMRQAAGAFSMNHFMGKVAAVHCRLRGWSDLVEQGSR